jgi:hypothetical protein
MPEDYTQVPSVCWQGPWASARDQLESECWQVWAGVTSAVGAIAHRNLHTIYYNPMYGMTYILLIGRTGVGKTLATSLARALLPPWYKVANGVQSGPALGTLLADIERDKAKKIVSISSTPAALILPEWTRLATAAQFSFSTLVDDLNNLFHEPFTYDLTRGETTGGRVVIDKPTLSILGTTTKEALLEKITPQMINGGFLNRYLILPTTTREWTWYEEVEDTRSPYQLAGLLDYLPGTTWGGGAGVWKCYTPAAKERMIAGGAWFQEVANERHGLPIPTAVMMRLHLYAHLLSCLYAYACRKPLIEEAHVAAALAITDCSCRFLIDLFGEMPVHTTAFTKERGELEQRVLTRIQKYPTGIERRELMRSMAKYANSNVIGLCCDDLLKAGLIEQLQDRPVRYKPVLGWNETSH